MPMMPDLQSSLLCDDVRQERSGKFILIGIFDMLGSATFPLRHPRMYLVTRWCSGEGDFTQQTNILGPDMTPIATGRRIPVRLANSEASATNIEVFLNTEFRAPGLHWVEISLDDDLKLRFPLRVRQLEPRPGQPPAPPMPG